MGSKEKLNAKESITVSNNRIKHTVSSTYTDSDQLLRTYSRFTDKSEIKTIENMNLQNMLQLYTTEVIVKSDSIDEGELYSAVESVSTRTVIEARYYIFSKSLHDDLSGVIQTFEYLTTTNSTPSLKRDKTAEKQFIIESNKQDVYIDLHRHTFPHSEYTLTQLTFSCRKQNQ